MTESTDKPRGSGAGFLAILFSLLFIIPLFLNIVGRWFPRRMADNIAYNAGNFIFDFGAISILGLIICAAIGIYQGGRSRKLAGAALAIFLVPVIIGIAFVGIALLMSGGKR